MKKQLSLASKRKWVTGGILAFSAVSLLTTGFATWVVGVQRTAQEGSIGVTVDTASNGSIRISADLPADAGIKLVEPEPVSGADKLVRTGTGGIEVDANGLKVTFETLKVTWGLDSGFDYHKVAFGFGLVNEDGEFVEDKTPVTVTTNGLSTLTATYGDPATAHQLNPRTGSSWTYIEAPEALTIGEGTTSADGKSKTYEFTNKTVEFSWGTFFKIGETQYTPANFYNEALKDFTKATDTEYSAIVDAVGAELKAMEDHFKAPNNKLQIVAYLVA